MMAEPSRLIKPAIPSRGIRRSECAYAIATGALVFEPEPEPESEGDPWQDGVLWEHPTSD